MNPRLQRRPARTALVAAGLAVLLALPAAAAVRIGTPASEILTGTNGKDLITGGAGSDTLRGLAGNDTYHFDDNFGDDLLEEKASYKVNGKKLPGGFDTLSFRNHQNSVFVHLIPEWRVVDAEFNQARGLGSVDLGGSVVEGVVGGRLSDILAGGGGANRLVTGGDASDTLQDFGGWDDGAGGRPELPASNDTYAGAAANPSFVFVQDWGGTADVLDLRPLRSDEAYLDRENCDGDPELECLLVMTGTSANSNVTVAGHFGAFDDDAATTGQRGRIESLRFADGTFTFAGGAGTASARERVGNGEALIGKATTERQKRLADRTPALAEQTAKEALAILDRVAPPSVRER